MSKYSEQYEKETGKIAMHKYSDGEIPSVYVEWLESEMEEAVKLLTMCEDYDEADNCCRQGRCYEYMQDERPNHEFCKNRYGYRLKLPYNEQK